MTAGFVATSPSISFGQGTPTVPAGGAYWRELATLSTDAVRLGIPAPRLSAQVDSRRAEDFLQLMPAAVDLIDSITASAGLTPSSEANSLLIRSSDLLQRMTAEERNQSDQRPAGQSLTAMPGRPSFDSIKDDYRRLFDTVRVRDQYATQVRWYVSKLEEPKNRRLWYEVAKEACCPWYFVGIIHALECSFNFRAHLHNGDPIDRRTVQVPANRPAVWNPPTDWITSAVDAVEYDGFAGQTDWSLERTLYRWESYNGFRSRRNGINTPYLWSFSNHYSKGKFVADNVWDPNAVSKQCGAAVILRGLVDKGYVKFGS
jgi:lysozyme family protein